MPQTAPDAFPYPDAASHTRLWEHIQALAEAVQTRFTNEWEAWRVVGAAGQPAFENGSADNSGAAGGPFAVPAFRKSKTGDVRLKGRLTAPTTIGGVEAVSRMFLLPVGYRPPARMVFAVVSNGAFGRVDIYPGGTVSLFAGASWVDLSGINFAAA